MGSSPIYIYIFSLKWVKTIFVIVNLISYIEKPQKGMEKFICLCKCVDGTLDITSGQNQVFLERKGLTAATENSIFGRLKLSLLKEKN